MIPISLCIPIYDPNENYEQYLTELFSSVSSQTQWPKEILLGGNSVPSYLKRIMRKYPDLPNVKFYLNKSNSTSENLNFLANRVNYDITKVIFQDDYFISECALGEIEKKFQTEGGIWLAAGSKNFDDKTKLFVRDVVPKYSTRLKRGINTIGSPSSISYRSEAFIQFNENLTWMLDCDWYLRMKHKFGRPMVIKKFHTANRLHPGQATVHAQKRHEYEVAITRSEHTRVWNLEKRISGGINCLCELDGQN